MKTVRHRARELGAALAVGLLLFAPMACSDWLNVQTPDIINPPNVGNAGGAQAEYNGAIGAFAFANDGDAGATEGQVLVSGVTADEYFDAETFPTRIEYDSRNITEPNGTLTTVFFNLSQARVGAEHAAAALEQYSPTPDASIGEMFDLAGFTYVYFAENYCSGVPFDERLSSGALQYGQPQSTTAILNLAISRFDSSLAHDNEASAAAAENQNLARIGLGRALLDQGSPAAAAAAVAAVPTAFAYYTVHSPSTSREQNGVFVFNNQAPVGSARFSVSDGEGGVGLNFRTAGDPRVSAPQNKLGFDKQSPLYVLTKYTSNQSPVVVASGVEARLIEAEAAEKAGDSVTAMARLNALRTVAPGGLAALADPGSDTARVSLIFRERAFWMFATGHRLGDLRRLVRQYGRAINSVYPNGAYLKTAPASYGTSTELPVPFQERNNPNYTGCNYTTP